MSHKFTIRLLAAVFLAAPLALSGSARAEVNNTTTRSNTQHNITFQGGSSNQNNVKVTPPKFSAPTIAPHH
jgi:hypothetical protein